MQYIYISAETRIDNPKRISYKEKQGEMLFQARPLSSISLNRGLACIELY